MLNSSLQTKHINRLWQLPMIGFVITEEPEVIRGVWHAWWLVGSLNARSTMYTHGYGEPRELWLQQGSTDAPASTALRESVTSRVPGLAACHIARRMITRMAHHAMQRRYESRPVPAVVTALAG